MQEKLGQLKKAVVLSVSFLLCYYFSILSPEYWQSLLAFLAGFKSAPFAIQISGWYLHPTSESINFAAIVEAGHYYLSAFIAISGVLLNAIWYLVGVVLLARTNEDHGLWRISIVFWLLVVNLMIILSYVPNRIFMTGEINEFVNASGFSPIWCFVISTLLVGIALYRFYWVEFAKVTHLLALDARWSRRLLLWATFVPLAVSVIYWRPPSTWVFLSYLVNAATLFFILWVVTDRDPKE